LNVTVLIGGSIVSPIEYLTPTLIFRLIDRFPGMIVSAQRLASQGEREALGGGEVS
jgi:hypothetical protein